MKFFPPPFFRNPGSLHTDSNRKRNVGVCSKPPLGLIFIFMWFDFLRKGRNGDKKKETRYILTIDGGGMRGIVPAYILKKTNEELKRRGIQRPLYSYFDLVAGTSTGALIALGLTAPTGDLGLKKEDGDDWVAFKTVEKGRWRKRTESVEVGEVERLGDVEALLELYSKNGRKIFIPDDSKGFWKLVGKVTKMLGDKYDAAPLEEFLLSVYGDTALSDARVPTMAVSTNADGCTPYIFRSWDSKDWLLREAARATSAAPTYFAPAVFMERDSGEFLTLIDGGILANNPILLAYSEARKLYPEADEFRILSLSTASPMCVLQPDEYTTNLDWLVSLTSAYSSGNMNVSLSGVESIKGVRVDRIWEPVLKKKIKLDDTSPEAISSLMAAAEEIWDKDKEKIFSFLDEVTKEEVHDSLRLKDKNATATTPEPLPPPQGEPSLP